MCISDGHDPRAVVLLPPEVPMSRLPGRPARGGVVSRTCRQSCLFSHGS